MKTIKAGHQSEAFKSMIFRNQYPISGQPAHTRPRNALALLTTCRETDIDRKVRDAIAAQAIRADMIAAGHVDFMPGGREDMLMMEREHFAATSLTRLILGPEFTVIEVTTTGATG